MPYCKHCDTIFGDDCACPKDYCHPDVWARRFLALDPGGLYYRVLFAVAALGPCDPHAVPKLCNLPTAAMRARVPVVLRDLSDLGLAREDPAGWVLTTRPLAYDDPEYQI
jgi:hypothetical protein